MGSPDAGLHDQLQLANAFVALLQVEQRAAEVIMRLRQLGIDLQHLPTDLDGPLEMAELALRFCEEDEELRLLGRTFEAGFELLARLVGPRGLEIDLREEQAGGEEGRA